VLSSVSLAEGIENPTDSVAREHGGDAEVVGPSVRSRAISWNNFVSLTIGEHASLEHVRLEGSSEPVCLDLERIRVFAEGAEIVAFSAGGERKLPVPGHAYFFGKVRGVDRSRAFVTLRTNGEIRGVISERGETWLLRGQRGQPLSPAEKQHSLRELSAKSGFRCSAEDLIFSGENGNEMLLVSEQPRVALKVAAEYTARVAIDTDYEFLQIFSASTSLATDYVGDLFGYASGIYEDEIDTSLVIQYLSFWEDSNDPWGQTSTICTLYEFGRYWNHNRSGVDRTIAHFLSGRNMGGGVAWKGVLCSNGFSPAAWGAGPSAYGCSLSPENDAYGGAYGMTANINGGFDVSDPRPTWDIISVSHEIGHNFSSPHTHCYKNLQGNPNPIDECYAGSECTYYPSQCNCNTPHLPCAQAGGQCGTIMSYCHQLSGGYNNIALSFGEGHPYGIAPERVPAQMKQHVVSRAASNPACLDHVEIYEIFDDDFESEGTGAWTDTVP
jgi:hypothetical protein